MGFWPYSADEYRIRSFRIISSSGPRAEEFNRATLLFCLFHYHYYLFSESKPAACRSLSNHQTLGERWRARLDLETTATIAWVIVRCGCFSRENQEIGRLETPWPRSSSPPEPHREKGLYGVEFQRQTTY
ncbi:SGF29 tudor-like domain [Striga asiatica]|uniref:SGF29 tudor-like domain n=1 Tax=Striga asiatica TaxID=4170 RepID=A0A5A7PX79_STRAF|nr:SGF29 tudor-like domain [Striga asiatica]